MTTEIPNVFTFTWIIDEDAGTRLDVFLAEQDDPPLTRSQVKRRIKGGEVRLNNEVARKGGYTLQEGDCVVWRYRPTIPYDLVAQEIPLTLLYEDEDIAIVDKPVGMVVHPSPGHPDSTLVNALLYHFKELAVIGGEERPGIIHRIDKDTSGALAVTKSDRAHLALAKLFRTHTIERRYHAIVAGRPLPDTGTFRTSHGRASNHRLRFTGQLDSNRHAVTHYQVLERFPSGAQLVECQLETGRTHQIRMHFFEANCPLLGDTLYGDSATSESPIIRRQALHAYTLGFQLFDKEIKVIAPYPDDFAQALEKLRAGKAWRG